jgi:uncharacterized damage-inducible protein DinB
MNDRELFVKKWEQEHPAFVRVLEALPPDRLDYRPHPKSRSAAELVCLLAHESKVCCDLIDTGEIDWREPKPSRLDEMIEAYEDSYRELTARLKKLDDSGWERYGRFVEEGHLVIEGPQREIFWLLLFDAIHHRGQLSAYIRPMGGKVPSIYGPSGDAMPA